MDTTTKYPRFSALLDIHHRIRVFDQGRVVGIVVVPEAQAPMVAEAITEAFEILEAQALPALLADRDRLQGELDRWRTVADGLAAGLRSATCGGLNASVPLAAYDAAAAGSPPPAQPQVKDVAPAMADTLRDLIAWVEGAGRDPYQMGNLLRVAHAAINAYDVAVRRAEKAKG